MIKKYLIKFWPFLYIIGIWFVFSNQFFIGGRAPFPSTYQATHFHPWSIYQTYLGPVKNDSMPDVVGEIYPWKHFDINSLKNFSLPYWNPYAFAGNPHIANYQSAVFSPFNLLFLFLSFINAWSIIVLLQPLLAGFFTFLLMREYNVSKIGSLVSSLSFMFCGFIVAWMAYGTLAMAIAFLPLTLFGIERYFKNGHLKTLILSSASITISLFSGHLQTSFYLLIFVGLYLVFKFYVTRDIKKFLTTWFFILLGVVISLPQVIPSINLYFYSTRSTSFINTGKNQSGIPFYYLITSFIPDFFGNPITRNNWFGSYIEWASFVGIFPLIFSTFAFVRKKSLSFFFGLSMIFSLLFAIDSPIQKSIIFLKLPIISTSYPARIIVLFSFSIAVLAGFGFDNLFKLIKNNSLKRIYLTLAIFVIFFCALWFIVLTSHLIAAQDQYVVKRNLIIPSILFLTAVFLILLTKLKYKLFLLIATLILVLLSFDSLRFAEKWMPFDPKNLVYKDLPVIDAMKKYVGQGRIFGNIGNEISVYYQIPSVEGYDPLYIERYGEFIAAASTGTPAKPNRYDVLLSRNGKYTDRVLDLLGVDLIYYPIADTFQSWAYPIWQKNGKYSVVWHDDRVNLYKNNSAMPRTSLFYNYEVLLNSNEILKRFYNDNFKFRDTLILEENPGDISSQKSDDRGETKIISYTPNKVIIKVSTEKPALLFLSDNYYPAWKAKVNGKETKIYRADYSFRAIVVPSGKSTVDFYYDGFL